jgi:hypothetical protein
MWQIWKRYLGCFNEFSFVSPPGWPDRNLINHPAYSKLTLPQAPRSEVRSSVMSARTQLDPRSANELNFALYLTAQMGTGASRVVPSVVFRVLALYVLHALCREVNASSHPSTGSTKPRCHGEQVVARLPALCTLTNGPASLIYTCCLQTGCHMRDFVAKFCIALSAATAAATAKSGRSLKASRACCLHSSFRACLSFTFCTPNRHFCDHDRHDCNAFAKH